MRKASAYAIRRWNNVDSPRVSRLIFDLAKVIQQFFKVSFITLKYSSPWPSPITGARLFEDPELQPIWGVLDAHWLGQTLAEELGPSSTEQLAVEDGVEEEEEVEPTGDANHGEVAGTIYWRCFLTRDALAQKTRLPSVCF